MRKSYINTPFLLGVIVLLCLVTNDNIYSQNFIDPILLDSAQESEMVVSDIDNYYILGWNWGSPGAKLDDVLNINTYHNLNTSSTDYNDGMKTIEVLEGINGSRSTNVVLNAHALYLEPTITPTTEGAFVPRAGDYCGAVFGWKNINETVCSIPSSGRDFHRLVIDSDGITTPTRILDTIWNSKIIHYLDYNGAENKELGPNNITNHEFPDTQEDIDDFYPFNCKQFYLSINLRATDVDELEDYFDEHPDEPLLTIKMPYILKIADSSSNLDGPGTTENHFVKFDSIPNTAPTASPFPIIGDENNDFRGWAWPLNIAPTTTPTTEFVITSRMIYNSLAQSLDSSITLSAFAVFNGIPSFSGGYVDNPRFRPDWWLNCYNYNDFIEEFDITVDYHGHVDLAIDWIKLETPRAQQLFRGYYDDSIAVVLNNVLDRYRNNSKKPKIYRFYGNDEVVPSEWQAMRYYNMLMDTAVTLEAYVDYKEARASAYLHSTGFRELWNGNTIGLKKIRHSAAPYIKKAYLHDSTYQKKTFYYSGGYCGSSHTYPAHAWVLNNTLDSDYETNLCVNDSVLGIKTIDIFTNKPEIYEKEWIPDGGTLNDSLPKYLNTQSCIESDLYHFYYKNLDAIYGKTPWLANIWLTAGLRFYDLNNDTLLDYDNMIEVLVRAKTGEETRLDLSYAMILGAKGNLYWVKTLGEEGNTTDALDLGLQLHTAPSYQALLPTGEELIYDDTTGRDYLYRLEPFYYKWNEKFKGYNYDWTTLGVDSNHFYIGLQSTRSEVYKQNAYLNTIGDELLDLNLLSWYGKGHIKMYCQHPDIETDTIIKQFIDYDNIRTKRIWNAEEGLYQSTYEDFDSSFFDVTLLKDIDDEDMDSVFFIGALNRRTDPLEILPKNWTGQ
jgi:hypothetical protein